MDIRTIEDFLTAPEYEIKLVEKDLDLISKLQKYLAWMNSPTGHRVEATFRLGYSGEERKLGLHASQLSQKGKCKLSHYYDATEEQAATQTTTLDTQIIYDHGTVIHSLFQTYFLDMFEHSDGEGNDFIPEFPVVLPEWYYTSSTDGLLDRGSYRALFELKSVKEGKDDTSYGFAKYLRSPSADHVRQLRQYMKIADVPFGYILYYCKNNGKMKGYTIRWDQEEWDSFYNEELHPVLVAINTKTPPEPKIGFHCKDCQWRIVCPHGKKYTNDKRTKEDRYALARAKARNRR